MNFLRSSHPLAFALFAFAAAGCTSSPSTSGPGGSGGKTMTGTGGNQGGVDAGGGSPGSGGSGGDMGSGGSSGSGGSGGSPPMDANGADTAAGGSGGTTGADSGADTTMGACLYKFCEDFESDTSGSPPNPARWHQDGTPTVVDAVQVHKGAHALHVLPHKGALCTDGMPCLAARFARLTDAFPTALHKQHYGRLFFYINQAPTDAQYYHWMVMEVNASTSYSGGLALRQGGEINGPNSPGKDILLTHVDTHDKTGCMPPPSPNCYETERGRVQTQTPIMNKTWYCLEWFIDATNQQAQYWLDGTQRPGLDWKGPVAGQPQFNLPAEFKSLAVGMRVFQVSNQNFELFVDDVALDSKKIGCN
jgi:hypothetical protein